MFFNNKIPQLTKNKYGLAILAKANQMMSPIQKMEAKEILSRKMQRDQFNDKEKQNYYAIFNLIR